MKPLYVLIIVFVLALAGTYLFKGTVDWQLSGRIAMSLMLLFTAMGHFKFPDAMARMIPPTIPARRELVLLSGFFEIAAAVCFLIPQTHLVTTWALIVFFVISLPFNIYAAIHKIDYQSGTNNGPGPGYLWFRVPLQVLFILWVWFS